MSYSVISASISTRLKAKELQERYTSGQRNFEHISLIGVNLKGLDLRYINLKNADLSNSDLTNAILYGANLEHTNLNRTKLNGARLQGAFLANATLVCSHLSDANLRDSDLSNTSLDAANLKRAVLEKSDLSGAYLIGADLQQASLKGAYFDRYTQLPEHYDLNNQEMLLEANISIDELLDKFNYLTQYGNRYLGPILTTKNWQSTRPDNEWLQQININTSQVTFSGLPKTIIKQHQKYSAKKWLIDFINMSSEFIKDFSLLINQEKIIF